MAEHEWHVILGASGGVGNAVVRELVAQGKRVRGVTRSGKAAVPAGVELVAADISQLDQALGQAWHIPAAEPLTGSAFLKLVFEEMGIQGKVTRVTPLLLRLAGLSNPLAREAVEMTYEFEQPFIMDSSKFARAFGGAPTPHQEAIRQTVDWFKARKVEG